MKSNDKDIINAIRSGNNEKVLSNLYKDFLPRIRKMILQNSGNDDDTKDIFQDTVLIFYNHVKLNKYDESKDIGGFMYSVARNLWISKVKKDNRNVQLTETESIQDVSSSALNSLINDEKVKAIEDVMGQIGKPCQKLLIYTIFDKLSLKEVAQKMGYANEGVAKTNNYRCKQKLMNLVKDNSYLISLFKG
ncbi:MAG: RNA polymerase sigma factor [Cytophagaceae bacterium]